MHKIDAKIIADSISPQGHRITSFILTYPRFIHSELMTHRMFSRNASSSRAVPIQKMIETVKNNTFCPFEFQKAHKGMQGFDYFTGQDKEDCIKLWLESAELALQQAEKMKEKGITKQLCNRLLEPFMWHTVLVTATEFENFFELRCPQYEYYDMLTGNQQFFKSKKDWLQYYNNKPLPKAKHISKIPENDVEWLQINNSQAEIHIQTLAESMWDALNESKPKHLKSGQWHIPFGDKIEGINFTFQDTSDNQWAVKYNRLLDGDSIAIKIATARCARLSYMTFDGEIDYEKDIKLHDQLLQDKHLSPFEHCTRAMSDDEYYKFFKGEVKDPKSYSGNGWCNNFRGWISYRYLIENDS